MNIHKINEYKNTFLVEGVCGGLGGSVERREAVVSGGVEHAGGASKIDVGSIGVWLRSALRLFVMRPCPGTPQLGSESQFRYKSVLLAVPQGK